MTFIIVLRCEPVCSDGLLQRCGETNVRSARKRYLLAISVSEARVGVSTMTFLIVVRREPVCSDGLLQRCGEMCAARENLTCLQSRSRKLDSKFRRGRS